MAASLPFLPRLDVHASAIDRRALVRRHNVVITRVDVDSPCQVGNGEFAASLDVTGLQTLAAAYDAGQPLGTMAQWAWHSFPGAASDTDAIYTLYDSHGRKVPYADGGSGYASDAPPSTPHPAVQRRANPHRFDLGRLAFVAGSGSRPLAPADIAHPRQELDLWTGRVESRFELDGLPVTVTSLCHPEQDAIAVRIQSPLLASGRLAVALAFPYAAGEWGRAADWSSTDRHVTRLETNGTQARFERVLDETRYVARMRWSSSAATLRSTGPHRFELQPGDTDALDIVLGFAPGDDPIALPAFNEARDAAASWWARFWTSGGAIDLSGSTDPRARELERRIVLSQYLTAVNCAGSVPPQETGLATNSWYGKHHLEMHWWHAAHFALWNRAHLLERSLPWYTRILPQAREAARRQGYRGARWPKQVGIDGVESPSAVAVFLIWQQPHPIFFAELLHRLAPGRDTIDRYAEIVFETAEFMASYAAWDGAGSRYVLGPPLIPAQETYGPIRARVINPTFELAYWSWGLAIAQQWRERAGLPRHDRWDHVIAHLSRPTVREACYAAIEVEPFTEPTDHPSMLAALGMLPPTQHIDAQAMSRTLDDVLRRWDWKTTWGWDYPMIAMTAARLGRPEAAVDALLMDSPKNQYLASGHNFQTRGRLPVYLPGNGGLLYAAAMMAAGWDGGPDASAPGFPRNGRWQVRTENLRTAP